MYQILFIALTFALLLLVSRRLSMNMESELFQRVRAEEEMRQSEEKFAKAFQTSPYAIAITRVADGKFIEINNAFASIIGYSRAELMAESSIGLKLWVKEKDRDEVVSVLRQGLPVIDREFLFRKKNGDILIGLFSSQIIQLNQEPCLLSSINDITERKETESQKEAALAALHREQMFSKSVLDNLPGIFYLYTYPENRLVLWNKQLETLLGFNAEEMKDRHITEWFPPQNRKALLKAIDKVMEKGQSSWESYIVAKDGRQIPFFLPGIKIGRAHV
jgi:PAS domain S-box-containing protein